MKHAMDLLGRRTGRWLGFCALFAALALPAHAQFDRNLVVNGDAEAIDAVTYAPLGWTISGGLEGNFYDPGSAPKPTDPGPPDRGRAYFLGGCAVDGRSSATQTINVAQGSAVINRGGVTFSLSAYLGALQGTAHTAAVTATFLNSSSVALAAFSIGPSTNAERQNRDALLFRSVSAIVPVGTTMIVVRLDLNRDPALGQCAESFADNISLVLHAPKLDVRGSGRPQLALSNNSTGQVGFWFLNGSTVTEGQLASATLPAGWQVAGSGDFNGDAISDLVLQNPSTGQVAFWFMNGAAVTGGTFANRTLPAGWRVAGVTDADGDGRADLVLTNPSTGDVAFWYMEGTAVVGGSYAGAVLPAGWQVAASEDMNGDGIADLVLQNPGTRQVAVWFIGSRVVTSGAYASTTLPDGWQIVGASDMDGDGRADLVLQNPSTGQTAVWLLGGVTVDFQTQRPTSLLVTRGTLLSGGALPPGWGVVGPK